MENQKPAPFEESKSFAQFGIFLGLTGIAIFVLMIGMMLAQMTGKVNLMVLTSTGSFDDPDVLKVLKVLQIASSIIIFILPAVVFAILASRKWADYLGLNRLGKISILLLGAILMVVASPLINFLQEINSHLELPHFMAGIEAWMKSSEAQDDALTAAFINHQTLTDLIVNLVMIALVAAISEEIFFRGVMQKILIKMSKNVHVGVWLTGIIFSAIHLQFYGFLPRMLMGVYLGYLFVWSGSLWVTIFAHFINNGAAVFFSYLEERKILSDSVDKAGTSEGSNETVYVLVSTALVVLLLVAIYKISKRGSGMESPAVISE